MSKYELWNMFAGEKAEQCPVVTSDDLDKFLREIKTDIGGIPNDTSGEWMVVVNSSEEQNQRGKAPD